MEENFEWITNVVHDHLVYVIICIEDNTILIENKVDNKSLIATTLNGNESWNDAARHLATEVSYVQNIWELFWRRLKF